MRKGEEVHEQVSYDYNPTLVPTETVGTSMSDEGSDAPNLSRCVERNGCLIIVTLRSCRNFTTPKEPEGQNVKLVGTIFSKGTHRRRGLTYLYLVYTRFRHHS